MYSEEFRSKDKVGIMALVLETRVMYLCLVMVCVCKWECSVELMLYYSLSYINKLESEHGGTEHFYLE